MEKTPLAVRLGEFAAQLRYEELPGAVVDKAKAFVNHAVTVGLVGAGHERSAAARFDFRYGAIESVLGSGEQRHRNAFGGERVGHAPPDSLAAAENECRFFPELKIHWLFSSRVRF